MIAVRVGDRDEPARAAARPWRAVVGELVTVRLTDPDRAGTDPASAVHWERWRSPGAWQAIPGATGLRYTPVTADAGRPLRALVSYADRHGPSKEAVAALPHPVVGPMLSGLAARTDSARSLFDAEGAATRPAFDPRIQHYGLRCAERDVVTVSFTAPPGVQLSVNGIQPRTQMNPGAEGAAAVSVTPASDVAVTVLDDSHDEGMETLTLTQASGAAIATASATGRIVNTDAMPQAWLARIGRKVAEQVIEAVQGRLRAPPRAGMEASLAGQALPRWRCGPPRTRSTAGRAASWRRRPT